MLELRLLGPIALADSNGAELRAVLAQPKRFALLAYLALSDPPGFCRRDTLLALFWPELDTPRARNALNQSLRHLRRAAGADVIVGRGSEDVGVDAEHLRCDVVTFRRAIADRCWGDAFALYRGELLPGFFIPDAPQFDEWMERERDRLRVAALTAAAKRAADLERAGDVTAAVEVARRAYELAPDDERTVRALMALLERAGDRAAALHVYERFARLLTSAFDAEPAVDTRVLAERLRRRVELPPRTDATALSQPLPAASSAPPEHSVGTVPITAAPRSRRRLAAVAVTIAGVILLAGVLASAKRRSATSGPNGVRSAIHTLAVLDFRNITGDRKQDYVAAELSEGVGRELTQLASIAVTAGASVHGAARSGENETEVARVLGVDAFVSGTVGRIGDRIRVTAELADTRSNIRLWARAWERPIDQLLSLYPEVARGIASELTATVAAEHWTSSSRGAPANPQAVEPFVRGEYFRKRWMANGCSSAVPAYREAIALDSTFAPAYAGLASCYAHPDRMRLPAAEVRAVAHWALARALALDSNSAPAHYYLAFVDQRLDYRWKDSGNELRRAVALDPRFPDARRSLGEYLIISGMPNEGIAMMLQSIELDPFHLDNRVALAFSLRNVGRYDEAIHELREVLALDPDYEAPTRLWIFESYALAGRYDAAVAEYLTWARRTFATPHAAAFVDSLATAYAHHGWRGFLRLELQLAEAERRHPGSILTAFPSQYVGAYHMARRYARLGADDRALAWLQRAYEERQQLMIFMSIEPDFVRLRHDPRFRAIASGVIGH